MVAGPDATASAPAMGVKPVIKLKRLAYLSIRGPSGHGPYGRTLIVDRRPMR
jgi:hypothetical protein